MANFRVSNAAVADLEGIARYTQETWGVEQRRSYLNSVNKQFEVLSKRPRIAPERTDFNSPVRVYHHEKHLIIYVIDDAGILILRVLHERMDVPTQLTL